MAYVVTKGIVSPDSVVPDEEREEKPEPAKAGRITPDQIAEFFRTSNSQPNGQILAYKTVPITDGIKKGDKVVRKIRPHDIGEVVSVVYLLKAKREIKDIWITFPPNRTDLPYSPSELELVVIQ